LSTIIAVVIVIDHTEMVQVTPFRCLLHNLNALVAISKGMWAVKLSFNKILQFLTGGAG